MEKITKEQIKTLEPNFKQAQGIYKSDIILKLSQLVVGDAYSITQQEFKGYGYKTPWTHLVSFVSSACFQDRKSHHGKLNGKKFSVRTPKDDPNIKYIIRIK